MRMEQTDRKTQKNRQKNTEKQTDRDRQTYTYLEVSVVDVFENKGRSPGNRVPDDIK